MYAAFGSAVHVARTQAWGTARLPWLRFDMPGIARSGYGAAEISCMLRWMRAGEAWWGSSMEQEVALMREILGNYRTDGFFGMLIGELLLAGSLGKVPRAAMTELVGTIKQTSDFPDAHQLSAGAAIYGWALNMMSPSDIALAPARHPESVPAEPEE
jgi:hypothetical protein